MIMRSHVSVHLFCFYFLSEAVVSRIGDGSLRVVNGFSKVKFILASPVQPIDAVRDGNTAIYCI